MIAVTADGRELILRAAVAAGTALLTSLIFGPFVIRCLKQSFPERIASDSARLNELHAAKKNTPTMGGLLIIASILAAVLATGRRNSPFVILALTTTVAMTLVGVYDDWIKLRTVRKGLTVRHKLMAQVVIAAATSVACFQLSANGPYESSNLFQMHGAWLQTGWAYIPWATFVIVGTSNAVNLTDGLDGLAAGCTFVTALALAVITVFAPIGLNNAGLREDSAMIFAALAGSTLGFLWFNRHPAQVFMGDAGSLPIGGLLAVTALACRLELILALVGLVFVVETLSVIIQVAWYRRTKRRVLLCSPLHNHFVFRGIPERRIVCGFLIATVIFALAGLLQALAF